MRATLKVQADTYNIFQQGRDINWRPLKVSGNCWLKTIVRTSAGLYVFYSVQNTNTTLVARSNQQLQNACIPSWQEREWSSINIDGFYCKAPLYPLELAGKTLSVPGIAVLQGVTCVSVAEFSTVRVELSQTGIRCPWDHFRQPCNSSDTGKEYSEILEGKATNIQYRPYRMSPKNPLKKKSDCSASNI